ncbi:hypothetical protein B0H12DRAFT_1040514, partial [Mycena haematopus]
RDFANPLVVPHMHFYPEENDGPISETYQAERWLEYTPSQLTPMFSKGFKRFWIEELARLRNGTFVIPHTLIIRNGILTSDASVVVQTVDGHWQCTEEEITVAADELELDYMDITAEFGEQLIWVDHTTVPDMPNQMRKLVDDDEDLYVVMVSPWADDVSGNKSKQYNKHMNMYTGNGCLPGRLLQQEFNISTSPHASSAEQFATFRDHVNSTEKNPLKCYNAATKRRCRCILRTPGLPADNPQQSEESCHMGSNANFPCRKCKWGGTTVEKESDTLYHQCHLAGVARTAQEIRENLDKQLQLSMRGDAKSVEEFQRNSGTKDKITQYWIETLIRKAKAAKAENPRRKADDIASELKDWLDAQPGDKMNPLLDIPGLDPSQDTPVELLHTILLGVIKYIWHMLNTSQWSDVDRSLLAIRLQSTDISGLTVPPIRAAYMIQYKNNLIGKHFKTLMQTLAFHVHDMSTPEQFVLVRAAGELGARLWVPEIHNMDEYLEQLKIAVANVIDAFDAVDPLRILTKIKLHLLAHIPDDVRRFGPLIRSSTEIYESYNAVFRLCSIFSNRLAPSRDISRKFASMSRVKHFLSGGYWWDPSLKQWTHAGNAVQQILHADPIFQRHLGWVPPSRMEPGSVKLFASKKKPALRWDQTQMSTHWNTGTAPSPESWWRQGRVLTAQSGDAVALNSWVFGRDSQGNTVIGRITELLVGDKSLANVEQFICSQERHPDFGWPILRRPNGVEITQGHQSFVILPSSSIDFVFSAQHDCWRGNCQPTIARKEVQERQETDRNTSLINHSDDDHFIINMAALHNFVKLCRALPRALTELRPLFDDRTAFHEEAAKKARGLRMKKRKKTAEKRKATAVEKKREAELAAAEAAAAELAVARGEELEENGEESDAEQYSGSESSDEEALAEEEDDEDLPVNPNRRKRKRQRRE